MKINVLVLFILLGSLTAGAQTATEIYFPKYIQGTGTFVPEEDRKVPFVARLKLNGLTPNATYRFYNRFVVDTTIASTGDGPYILIKDSGNFVRVTAASLAAPGRYGEFTTDSNGSYTGWFANEPGSGDNFIPGIQNFLRIVLNDGAGGGGVETIITVQSPVNVINFGTDAASGTGLRSTPLKRGAAKQLVLLYDNLLGIISGARPIAATFLESDGTDNSIANGYAPFYADSVNGVNKAWGTILPNNLTNGIRHIAVLSLNNASLERLYLSFDGKWPSVNNTTINTVNTTGGLDNVLVIDGSRIALLNFWLDYEHTDEELVTLLWNTSDEANALEYTVERSTDEGKTFAPVSTTRKSGNREVYEMKDSRFEKTTLYRVTMNGKDGEVLVSDVVKVPGVIKLTVFPNPVANQLVVKHSAAEAGASVQVISVDGRQLKTQNVQVGSYQTTVNVSTLVPGNYRLVYLVNGKKQSKAFVKQ